MFLFNIFIISFSSVLGDVRTCDNFYPSQSPNYNLNCTLICGLRFHPANETAICERGSSTPMACTTQKDCGRNVGAYCKLVPCYCEAVPNQHPYYIFHPDFPRFSICVVPTKWSHPDMPLVPFPWLTLIIVVGILITFAFCLVLLRWISPYLRKMQSKRESRQASHRDSSENAEASALFSSVLQAGPLRHSRICSSSRAAHGSQRLSDPRRFRARYVSWDRLNTTVSPTSCGVAEDKPPPYEVAIQMQSPPSGDEVQEDSSGCDPFPSSNEDNSSRAETSDYPSELPVS